MTDNGNTAPGAAQLSPVANMHDFARYITEGAEAIARIPALENEASRAWAQQNEAQRHSEALELRIIDYKDRIAGLERQLSEVERERDTFRQSALDAASQRDRIVSSLETAISMVQDDIRQVMPPVPQPEPTKEPEPEAGHFFEASSDDPTLRRVEFAPPAPVMASPSSYAPEAATGPTTLPASADPAPSQKYAGMNYDDYPSYVPLHEWIEGGGTEASYYHRKLPF